MSVPLSNFARPLLPAMKSTLFGFMPLLRRYHLGLIMKRRTPMTGNRRAMLYYRTYRIFFPRRQIPRIRG